MIPAPIGGGGSFGFEIAFAIFTGLFLAALITFLLWLLFGRQLPPRS